MPLHQHTFFRAAHVAIGPPAATREDEPPVSDDVREAVAFWRQEATARNDVYYFWMYANDEPVGDILLHDIDHASGESLVAYHIFAQANRGHGVGTVALRLLQRFVAAHTNLMTLVIITSDDNIASQTIAQRCGFVFVGAPREDPEHGMVFIWRVERPSE